MKEGTPLNFEELNAPEKQDGIHAIPLCKLMEYKGG